MKFSDMMIISEAAQGYRGGNLLAAVDHEPAMSLDECVHEFSMSLLESQIEGYETMNTQNDMLVEATVNAIQYGQTPNYDALIEGAFETLKKKIGDFFARIKKWLQSIIAKLKAMIDKIRMNGSQLWAKYGKSDRITKTDFSKMTFEGHKMNVAAISKFSTDSSAQAIEDLVSTTVGTKIVSPEAFNPEVGKDGKLMGNTEKAMKLLKDTPKSDRMFNGVKALCGGITMNKDSWKSDVMKALYGEKKEMKYGEGDFSVANIEKILNTNSSTDLAQISQEYEAMLKATKDLEDRFQAGADDIKATEPDKLNDINTGDKDTDKANAELNKGVTGNNNKRQAKIDYFNNYIAAMSDVYAAINEVKAVRKDFYNARFKQATSMLGKMITYKAKKDNNDASDEADIDVINFEL